MYTGAQTAIRNQNDQKGQSGHNQRGKGKSTNSQKKLNKLALNEDNNIDNDDGGQFDQEDKPLKGSVNLTGKPLPKGKDKKVNTYNYT